MRSAFLTFVIGVVFQMSLWACSCGGGFETFCEGYVYFDQVVYGRVDSMRSDETGAYFTVFETLKGSIQPNTQIVVEDDSATHSGYYGTCFYPLSDDIQQGDTVILPITDTVYRYDTITQQWVYMFNVGYCTNNFGVLKVYQGMVVDSGIESYYGAVVNYNRYYIDTTYQAYRDILLSGGCAGYDTIVSVEDIEPIDQKDIVYSSEKFSVDDVNTKGTFNCYNLSGQRILTNKGNTLDAAELRTGIYIVEYLNEGTTIRKKFFIP